MAEYAPQRSPAHQLPPPPVGDATVHSSSNVPTVECDLDLLLTSYEAKRIETFRRDIRLCKTDTEKYDKCIQKRDELLEESDKLVLRLAAFENVMSLECVSYKGRKERARPLSNRPRMTEEDGAAKWDQFVGIAAVGSDAISKLLPPLKVISVQWGKDFVQHYQLAGKGQHYCNKFSTAVKLHTREAGVRKLNQLLLRRFQIPGRRAIRAGVNPIEPVDLKNLASWKDYAPFVKEGDPDEVQLPFVDLTRDDLPAGFIFGRFGLMIRPPSDHLAGADPADSDTTAERVVDTNPTEVGVGRLSAAGHKNGDDAESLAHLASPSFSGGSPCPTPLSSPPSSLLAEIQSRSPTPEQTDTASSVGCAGGSAVTESCHDDGAQSNVHTTAAKRLRPRKEIPNYHEAPLRSSKPASRQPRPLDTTYFPKERCCPPEIPPTFLAILDKSDGRLVRRIRSTFNFPFQNMCHEHLKTFAKAMINTEPHEFPLEAEKDLHLGSPERSSHLQRRRASLSELTNNPTKRPRLHDPALDYGSLLEIPGQECRTVSNPIPDETYRQQMLKELQSTAHEAESWGGRTDKLIARLVQKSKPPTNTEAYFLCGEGAAQKVEFGQVDAPIFTQGQQRFRWKGKDRPVSQFFYRMEDLGLDRKVSVQIPSRKTQEESCETRTLLDVRDRFLRQQPTWDPWNLLDLQSPLPSFLPTFLEGDNCQLLLRIRDAVLMGSSAERATAPGQDWNTWRNVIDWALLSEGGHSTAPHMDSHAYSTWITAQEGRIGFGWMSRPSQQEEETWMADPQDSSVGEWRYVVLSPGQTVFFPSGTIHFVFRIRGEQTFALGGHVLQWSSIDRWLEVVVAQMKSPESTNEDMKRSASKYVRVVKGFLENRMQAGREEEVGGREAIGRFFSLLEVGRPSLCDEQTNDC